MMKKAKYNMHAIKLFCFFKRWHGGGLLQFEVFLKLLRKHRSGPRQLYIRAYDLLQNSQSQMSTSELIWSFELIVKICNL